MFGQELRAQRKYAGLTLARLGKMTGMSKGYLSGIENGKVSPPADRKIRKLARALGRRDAVGLLRLAWLDRMPKDVRASFTPEPEGELTPAKPSL